MSGKKLGIIIPVYNEGENIGPTVRAIEARVLTPHRIYLVYDFDEDSTLPAARKLQQEGVDLVFLKNSAGRAVNAIKKGLKEGEESFLLVTMADLSDDYGVVDAMVALADQGFAVVCGSRYAPGGRQIGGPFLKRTLSRLAGLTLKHLAGLPTADATNSFKLYRKELVEGLTVESDGGFEIGLEIVIKAHFSGRKVAEIPCTWQDRQEGTSRFRVLRWLPKYLRWYCFALKKRAGLI